MKLLKPIFKKTYIQAIAVQIDNRLYDPIQSKFLPKKYMTVKAYSRPLLGAPITPNLVP